MATETSIQALERQDFIGNLQKNQKIVYEAIKNNPGISDFELERITGLKINIITGRRNDLIKMGLVEKRGTKLNPYTQEFVLKWYALDKPKKQESYLTHTQVENLIKNIQKCNKFQLNMLKNIINDLLTRKNI